MKIFLGVLLALIIGALVFKIVKDQKPESESGIVKEAVVVASQPGGAAMHTVTIEEVIQAPSYTYMRVKEGESEYWIATSKEDMEVGSKYSFGDALEMNNFTSKELDRTFPAIYFVSDNPESVAGEQNMGMAPVTMGKPKVELKTDAVIEQSAGGVAVAELYKNRDKYANKKVRVKGKVAKVNNEVMDRNWVHIQDGTSDSGNFDLTVTTMEFVQVDDIVEFEGTLVLNKDFGAGYLYELIIEGGVIRR